MPRGRRNPLSSPSSPSTEAPPRLCHRLFPESRRPDYTGDKACIKEKCALWSTEWEDCSDVVLAGGLAALAQNSEDLVRAGAMMNDTFKTGLTELNKTLERLARRV